MNLAERNSLIVTNLPLVGFLVNDLCSRAAHLSREDLSSVGAVALTTAASSYDPSYGVPFGAFARRRIIGALADELRAQDWAPRRARKRIKELKAVQESLSTALGRTATTEEIAAAMGVDLATTRAAMADATRSIEALEDPTYDRIVFDGPTPEAEVLATEQIHMVHEAVAALPERLRFIIEEIYFHDRTVKDVAEETGLTHSAVSHARITAVRLLRDGFANHYSDDDPHAETVVHSKISPARRRDYLQALGERTAGGITRAAAAVGGPVVARA